MANPIKEIVEEVRNGEPNCRNCTGSGGRGSRAEYETE